MTAAEVAARSRAEQGLPPVVEDRDTVERAARLVAASRPDRRSHSRSSASVAELPQRTSSDSRSVAGSRPGAA